jgi:hypothetical protein
LENFSALPSQAIDGTQWLRVWIVAGPFDDVSKTLLHKRVQPFFAPRISHDAAIPHFLKQTPVNGSFKNKKHSSK